MNLFDYVQTNHLFVGESSFVCASGNIVNSVPWSTLPTNLFLEAWELVIGMLR